MLQYFETLRVPLQQALAFYSEWWYLIVPALLCVLILDTWKKYVKGRYFEEMEFVLISFSVPAEIEKSPAVMEQFFSSVFGMQSGGSWSDKFWKGRQQLYLSLEMVGIGGVVRFLIWMPKEIRDFIEAQLYAEYPEAELVEVQDYVDILDWQTISKDYFFFGSEYKLTQPDFVPIKTYLEFEDKAGDAMLDPMANAAELLSSLMPGEMAWIQILASPSDNHWREEGLKEVDKLMKREEKSEAKIIPEIPLVKDILGLAQDVVSKGPAQLFGWEAEGNKKEKPAFEFQEFASLSPGERMDMEAMERNMGKVGFNCKIRFCYAAPKDIARSDSVTTSLFGIFWQVGALNSNQLAPHKKYWTKIDYFFPKIRGDRRKKRFWERYVKRSFSKGAKPFVLTSEELATVFHIPTSVMKAPYIERIESRKGEPPHNLPVV